MASPLDSFIALILNFVYTYVVPYLVIIVILGGALWIGARVAGTGRFNSARNAILGEVRLNVKVCASVLEYSEQQKVGNPYTVPIPRFYTTAFDNLRNQGYLFRLKREISEELVQIYLTIDRIHAACDRQEELAVGSAATSPLAADLRSQNLSFIWSTVNNVVKPRLERFDTYYRKR